MNFFLAQTIIIARNGETEPWMQILVLAVMAVFWVIGSILKSRKEAEETRKAKGRERPSAKLRPTPFDRVFGQQRQIRLRVQPQRRQVAHTQPVEQKPSHTRQATTLRQPKMSDLPLVITQAQPKLKTIPKQEIELISVSTDAIQPGLSAEAAQLIDSLPSIVNFDEPEDLTRAILDYEVLGKPLSLRGPSEYIIGL